jgi:hypothetical protein
MYANPKVWKEQRDKKMALANHICEDCGEKAIHVHHIDGTTYNHYIENLKALCSKCHRAYHPPRTIDLTTFWYALSGGGKLRFARLEAGYTHKDVKDELGLPHSIVDAIEGTKGVDWEDIAGRMLHHIYSTNNKSILKWEKEIIITLENK